MGENDALATLLRELRERSSLTLREVSTLTGGTVSNAYLSQLEQGHRPSPNPRILTGDQVKATIEQGTELPYQTTSQNGSKLQFRKANLRLEVLPKIHPDGKVSMLVGINKDTIGDRKSTRLNSSHT